MEVTLKKTMYNIGYYTLAGLIILLAVGFMVATNLAGVALYQMIVYNIWSVLIIAAVVFDIIATNMASMKFISGLVIYGLSALCLIMGVIVYALMSVAGLIPVAVGTLFAIVIGFSVALSILSIIMYWQGERLIELKQERKIK